MVKSLSKQWCWCAHHLSSHHGLPKGQDACGAPGACCRIRTSSSAASRHLTTLSRCTVRSHRRARGSLWHSCSLPGAALWHSVVALRECCWDCSRFRCLARERNCACRGLCWRAPCAWRCCQLCVHTVRLCRQGRACCCVCTHARQRQWRCATSTAQHWRLRSVFRGRAMRCMIRQRLAAAVWHQPCWLLVSERSRCCLIGFLNRCCWCCPPCTILHSPIVVGMQCL